MNWEEQFKENIYKYCDNNIRIKVLLTGFMYLSPELEKEIAPKNLAVLTSKIVNDLIKKRTVREVFNPNSDVPYGMYEILPHKKLLDKSNNKNIEKLIVGICPSCSERSEFKFLGLQETYGEPYDIYDCKNCESSIPLEDIKLL